MTHGGDDSDETNAEEEGNSIECEEKPKGETTLIDRSGSAVGRCDGDDARRRNCSGKKKERTLDGRMGTCGRPLAVRTVTDANAALALVGRQRMDRRWPRTETVICSTRRQGNNDAKDCDAKSPNHKTKPKPKHSLGRFNGGVKGVLSQNTRGSA